MIDIYHNFVRERHLVWEKRQLGLPGPWTEDPTLSTRKFTNVFRVLDPGSQFVLTDLRGEGDPVESLARCFLYRHTNQPSAWRAYSESRGRTLRPSKDLGDLFEFWTEYKKTGAQVFRGAYMINPQKGVGTDKTRTVIETTRRLLDNGSFLDAVMEPSLAGKFEILTSNAWVGDFMAMQTITDYGYLFGPDREDTFVVAGPGSKRGAKVVHPTMKAEDAIAAEHDYWATADDSPTLPNGRRLSMMDVQNTFCEFSKYVRGPRKGAFVPTHPGDQPEPVLPAHW